MGLLFKLSNDMKERLVIVARLLEAKQITIDEAVLLLEKETEFVYNPYNYPPYNPWVNPQIFYTTCGTGNVEKLDPTSNTTAMLASWLN